MAAPDRAADEILGALTEAFAAGLDDGGAAAGEGLLRMAVAGRGVWDVLGDLARLDVDARVTFETTLSDFVRLLPADAQAALGVVGHPGTPDPLTVTYELAERVARVVLPRAELRGLSFGGVTVEVLEAEDVKICVTGDFDALTVTLSAGKVRARGLAMKRRTETLLGALEADDLALEAHDLAPDPGRVDDPERPLRAWLTVARGAVEDALHAELALGRAEGEGLRVDLDQGEGRVALRIAAGRARGLAGPREIAAGSGAVRGLCASVRDPGGKLPLLAKRPERPEIEAEAEHVEGAGLAAPIGRVASASADDVTAHRADGRLRIEAARGEAQGLSAAVAGEAGNAPAALPAWVRAIGAAVRDVEASAKVALPPAHLGIGPASVDIEAGTNAEAQILVRGGRIEAPETRLTFDRPLDGPLWADIRGATLSEDGRAKVEVDGFPDPDVTRIVAWVLDLPERRIPLDLTTLSGLVADRLEAGGGPSLPKGDVKIDAEAARVTTEALALPIGHARVEVGASEVDGARVHLDGAALRAEAGRVAGEGLVVNALERPRPAEAPNAPAEVEEPAAS